MLDGQLAKYIKWGIDLVPPKAAVTFKELNHAEYHYFTKIMFSGYSVALSAFDGASKVSLFYEKRVFGILGSAFSV